jgi:hypothetical protein
VGEASTAVVAPVRWRRLIWLAFKAAAAALIATLATGLVLFGVDQVLSIILVPICRTRELFVCDAAKWWSSWWWLTFIVLSRPLLVLWNVAYVRRFAKPGERLAVGGVQLVVVAADGLLWTMSAIASGSLDPNAPVWLVLSALLVVRDGDTELGLIAFSLLVYLVVLAAGMYCCRSGGQPQNSLTVPAR